MLESKSSSFFLPEVGVAMKRRDDTCLKVFFDLWDEGRLSSPEKSS